MFHRWVGSWQRGDQKQMAACEKQELKENQEQMEKVKTG